MEDKVKILIAEDHTIVRQGLCKLLKEDPNFEVVAETADGESTVRQALELLPNIVIMDVSLPLLGGIEAAEAIIEKRPEIKILFLSMHSRKEYIIKAMETGASGYLIKNSASDEVIKAIKTIMNDEIYMNSDVSKLILEDYIKVGLQKKRTDLQGTLTDREKEILNLLVEGFSNKEIADMLSISKNTVANHRAAVMRKLHVNKAAQLVRKAVNEGLATLD